MSTMSIALATHAKLVALAAPRGLTPGTVLALLLADRARRGDATLHPRAAGSIPMQVVRSDMTPVLLALSASPAPLSRQADSAIASPEAETRLDEVLRLPVHARLLV